MDCELEKLLAEYPELFRTQEGGKIKCHLSGHEMPARLDAVRAYVNGRKFSNLRATADLNYKDLEPLIISSVKRKHQLFCCLTNRYIGKRRAYVERHMAGHRYKRALVRYNAGELLLFKESGTKGKQEGGGVKQEGGATAAALEADVLKDEEGVGEGAWIPSSSESEGEGEQKGEKGKWEEREDLAGHSAESTVMDVEEAESCGEGEKEEQVDWLPRTAKLKKLQKVRTTGVRAKNLKFKIKKSKKTATVVSDAIQVTEPGDGKPLRKRKITKGNTGFKRVKLVRS